MSGFLSTMLGASFASAPANSPRTQAAIRSVDLGGMSVSSTGGKFNGSVFKTGEGSDLITVYPADTTWQLSSAKPWTVEFWFKTDPATVTPASNYTLGGIDFGTTSGVLLRLPSGVANTLRIFIGGSSFDLALSTTYRHFAFVNDGAGTCKLYVDGTLRLTNSSFSYTPPSTTKHKWYYGSTAGNAGQPTYYFDELRISNNARYTTNFTPQTAEFSDDDKTLGLFHFNNNYTDDATLPFSPAPPDYWIATFARSGADTSYMAIEDTNGDVFVCGGVGGLSKGYLAKFNSAGTLQFQVSYGGQMGASIVKMMLTSSGELLFVSQTSGNDIGLAVVNKSTGAINSWYEYQQTNNVTVWTAALDSSNNVYIAGSIQTATSQETLIMKLSASTYNISWQKSYGGAGSEQSLGLAVDSSGNSYVSGQRSTTGTGQIGGQDMTLIKVDTNGNLTWAVNYGGSGTDQGRGCAIDGEGYIYTVGTTASNTFGGNDLWITKWNTNGTIVWSKNFGSSATETASLVELAVDSSNNIYAVVTASTANGNDALVVSFNNSGDLLWDRIYRQNSTANDNPNSITIKGNNLYIAWGSVFTDTEAIIAKIPKDNSITNGTYGNWVIEDATYSLNSSNSWTRNTTSLTFANTSLSRATPTIPTTTANPFTVTVTDINP